MKSTFYGEIDDLIQVLFGAILYYSIGEDSVDIVCQHIISTGSITENKPGFICLNIGLKTLNLNSMLILWNPDALKVCLGK